MIIDGHTHAAGAFADAGQIADTLDDLGVDKIVLCPSLRNNTQLKTPESLSIPLISRADKYFLLNRLCRLSYRFLLRDQGDGNAFVQHLAQQLPQRIIPFYWLDPQGPGSLQRLERALDAGSIQGIKLHQACNPFRGDGLAMHAVAEFAAQRSLPVFIHPYSKREVRRLIGLVRCYPQTTFILAHLIGLEIVVDEAAGLPNLFYDVSGGDVISPGRLALALKALGPGRLILGSDAPFGNPALSLARVRALAIPDAQKALILGETLRALCCLEDG